LPGPGSVRVGGNLSKTRLCGDSLKRSPNGLLATGTNRGKYADTLGPRLGASPGGVICSLPANEPKNDCERNRLPERCLLSGILGVGWPFPFYTTQSERCVVEFRDRFGCVLLVANVVGCGIIAGPDFRRVGVKSMDIGGNSGPCFVCDRSSHYFVDPVVSRCMTYRGKSLRTWVMESRTL